MTNAYHIGRLVFIFLLSIAIFLSGCSKAEYIDSKGNTGKFSDFHGQWMIINYWAIWCKPCVEEIPELNHFSTTQTNNAVVLGVDFDQSVDQKLEQAINKLKIKFPVLIGDPSHILGFSKPQVLPTTLIFNPDGKLVKTLTGPQTHQDLIKAITIN